MQILRLVIVAVTAFAVQGTQAGSSQYSVEQSSPKQGTTSTASISTDSAPGLAAGTTGGGNIAPPFTEGLHGTGYRGAHCASTPTPEPASMPMGGIPPLVAAPG
ncbi:hypothetical protein PF008_g29665 [Phytophthora fragariae]|uniref:RxLR effector protein n=1 Tax=Phytophthora fragariae TaxID=53985 RepID=A0A6G0Q7V9_9STRA|nr:hypothetical protein PF008_g29665 [Phytophthora fragariae]